MAAHRDGPRLRRLDEQRRWYAAEARFNKTTPAREDVKFTPPANHELKVLRTPDGFVPLTRRNRRAMGERNVRRVSMFAADAVPHKTNARGRDMGPSARETTPERELRRRLGVGRPR